MTFDSDKWIKRQAEIPKDVEEFDLKDSLGKVIGSCFVNPYNPKQICAEIDFDEKIKENGK